LRVLLRTLLDVDDRFEVVGEAENGLTGVEVTIEQQPDVVVLDLAMPEMDGLEAIPHMRRGAPDARIVVLSGFEDKLMRDRALKTGAARYVEKGGDVFDLLDILEAVTRDPCDRP
jgi:DNA-binding NarL/FixJ family response regulator